MDPWDNLPELNKKAERYLKKAQDLLMYCTTCQPYDQGPVWVLGEETTVDELFDIVACPEAYRDDIAAHLQCPSCGAMISDRYADIGLEDRYARHAEQTYERAVKRYRRRIDALREHLNHFPSLALHNAFARTLLAEITGKRAESVCISERRWFRSRNLEGAKVFECENMWAPSEGLSPGGRFHHAGQSVLYVADSKELAIRESLARADEPSLIWYQEYSLESDLEDVLDLRYDWENYGQMSNGLLAALLASGVLSEPVADRSNKWQPQYFITRFIADCAKLSGYKGIIYTSTKYDGTNLAVFDSANLFVSVGKPQVYIYRPSEQTVFRFSI